MWEIKTNILHTRMTKRWRDTLKSIVYQTRLRAVIFNEAHCIKNWLVCCRISSPKLMLFFNIGENYFVKHFFVLVKFVALFVQVFLTATICKSSREHVQSILGMDNAYVVSESPCKPNITYEV